jgi:FkbM family methyltransferase
MTQLPTLSHTSKLGRLARYPLKLVPPTMVMPVLTGRLRGKRWIVGSGIHGCWLGWYESEKQRVISQEVKPDTVFYDVGANVGFYTLLASALVVSGRVVSFEPVPRNISYLKRHLDLNHAKNVDVYALAISDKNGVARFRAEVSGYMGHISSEGDFTVQTATLDSLVQDGRILPPNYIKMDIEGAEYQALLGARACFERYRPTLFLATHGAEIYEQCFGLLKSWGYEIRSICHGQGNGAELFAVPHAR